MYLQSAAGLYIMKSLLIEFSNENLEQREKKDASGGKSNKRSWELL